VHPNDLIRKGRSANGPALRRRLEERARNPRRDLHAFAMIHLMGAIPAFRRTMIPSTRDLSFPARYGISLRPAGIPR